MSIFEFFFKYKPIVYEKGRLTFQLLGSKWWFVPAVALAIVAAFIFYRAVTGEKRSPWLIVLRAITLAVLLFMLLRPVLNISTVLPQDSYLAVVFDNSESMTIKEDGTTTRAAPPACARRTAASAVRPVARPSSTRTTVRPASGGSGRPPR